MKQLGTVELLATLEKIRTASSSLPRRHALLQAEAIVRERAPRKDKPGTLKSAKTMYLRASVGMATMEEPRNMKGEQFEFGCIGMGNGPPYVRHERTGQWFILSWDDIVRLAIEKGITKQGEHT